MQKLSALILYVAFSVCLQAQSPVPLLTAGNFGVLAASTVTNTGATAVTGGLGLSPGTSVTGFPPGTLNGTFHVTDAVAAQAQIDLTAAFTNASGRSPSTLVAAEIGGTTITPGVYHAASSLQITGTVTLNGAGVYIFQIPTTLTTASASLVNLTGGATADNVFWQVGSSATLGTGSTFFGNILAQASITITTGAQLGGRALARTGAVTLDTNTLISPGGTGPSGGGTPPPGVPAPSSVILVAIGLACVALYQGRERLLRRWRKI